ncbi:MAG TPA: anthranilate phosphoribosyltransferase [Thermoplasmata archaeon]|nr:anthranilate phosphoribosyltransferase [Thermoplasmata archaeon]
MSGPVLARLLKREPLAPREIRTVFDRLVAPTTTDVERAGLLIALAGRSVRADELAGFAREMRRRATPFPIPPRERPVDLCGSGGARVPSFNVSTVAAFVVRAAGPPVVKHGNRSSTGLCGSSDLLEALGLPVTFSPAFARATYRRWRLAFLHAPLFHPATKAVGAVRRALGVPTVFNRLGPLANPAAVPYQVAGAPDPGTAELFAHALRRLGVRRGVTMASEDGCDEFSPRARTRIWSWGPGPPHPSRLVPERLLAPPERRGPWDPLPPPRAAVEAERLLRGGAGARRGSVLLTSGAALWCSGSARSIREGVEQARSVLDRGEALEMLERMREVAGGGAGGVR